MSTRTPRRRWPLARILRHVPVLGPWHVARERFRRRRAVGRKRLVRLLTLDCVRFFEGRTGWPEGSLIWKQFNAPSPLLEYVEARR
jgi:hypothetical protein